MLIDVEQIWLPNTEYWLLNTSYTYALCTDRHVCPFSKLVGMRKKQVCLPNKQHLSDHSFKTANMTAKCKIIMNITENFIGISFVYRYTCVYDFKRYGH